MSALQIRIVKLCGMLGSDHDGEVVNAARMILKVMKQHDLCWENIIKVGTPAKVHKPAPARRAAKKKKEPPANLHHQSVAIYILANLHERLSEPEVGFLQSMVAWERAPTEKQNKWLSKIAKRVGVVYG